MIKCNYCNEEMEYVDETDKENSVTKLYICPECNTEASVTYHN